MLLLLNLTKFVFMFHLLFNRSLLPFYQLNKMCFIALVLLGKHHCGGYFEVSIFPRELISVHCCWNPLFN